ncbi:MAG: hypothetical protein A2Y12_09350 [Planctomycetes bacterium GWF2_42_9]|nr:MAG: hypothetical protein A2Y12_09350 [Planctomycetes bacterium GWF2_42_9]
MTKLNYVEHFENGSGGWFGLDKHKGMYRPLTKNSVMCCIGPWGLDYDHAPPGAGYLQRIMGIYLKGPLTESVREMGGTNRFIEGGFSANLTNARLTFRLKGSIEFQGANLFLLVQGIHRGICSGWILTGQPIAITGDWSDQSVTVALEPGQWKCLGSRHDRMDYYGVVDIKTILSGAKCLNIHLGLFPICVMPKGPINDDMHLLRAGKDYPVWHTKLPDGYVMVDKVIIEYPGS